MTIGRCIVLDLVGVTYGTHLPSPTGETGCFVSVTLSALQMGERQRVFWLGAVTVARHARRIRLVVQLVTCFTPDFGRAHCRRLVTHGAFETRLHVGRVRKVSGWVCSRFLGRSAGPLMTARTVHWPNASVMTRVTARDTLQVGATMFLERGMTIGTIEVCMH